MVRKPMMSDPEICELDEGPEALECADQEAWGSWCILHAEAETEAAAPESRSLEGRAAPAAESQEDTLALPEAAGEESAPAVTNKLRSPELIG